MRIEKLIKRYFVNGYRQAKGHKRKKTLTLKKYFKKLLKFSKKTFSPDGILKSKLFS